MEVQAKMYIERDDVDIEVVIAGEFVPGTPEERYDRNGSGTPAFPPGIWNIEARIELTAEEERRAEDLLLEAAEKERWA
jgi:hypothetical protein